MSYNKTTWKKGDVISAQLLNHIEQGIKDNEPGYELVENKTVVFEGEVTTYEDNGYISGDLNTYFQPSDFVEIIFNGETYLCQNYADDKKTQGNYGARWNDSLNQNDFSEYPFYIGNNGYIETNEPGTYIITIKSVERSYNIEQDLENLFKEKLQYELKKEKVLVFEYTLQYQDIPYPEDSSSSYSINAEIQYPFLTQGQQMYLSINGIDYPCSTYTGYSGNFSASLENDSIDISSLYPNNFLINNNYNNENSLFIAPGININLNLQNFDPNQNYQIKVYTDGAGIKTTQNFNLALLYLLNKIRLKEYNFNPFIQFFIDKEKYITNKYSNESLGGRESFNIGSNSVASGENSYAEGALTTASGNYSHAEGYKTTASAYRSHAEGFTSTASGNNSHAEGEKTIASGEESHAEGTTTEASGSYSHVEGYYTKAYGSKSHAEGDHVTTSISGQASHAEGYYATASGNYSHAEGNHTIASNEASHAEGSSTTASGSTSHAEGGDTTASGDYSHAEGHNTTASKINSHAEGYNTKASENNSHAEGSGTVAQGISSHAEGNNTTSPGNYSHAEGYATHSTGQYSHAEGSTTTASDLAAHAEGYGTRASGQFSHAEGDSTIANHRAQHVFGQYNIEDSSINYASNRGTYIEIVGNGVDSSNRSNARTLDWSGNEELTGSITLGKGTTDQVTLTAAELKQLKQLLNS